MKNTHIILTGSSGAGKTTVGALLLEQIPVLTRFVTTTTRTKRSNEIEGVHYYFVTEDEFKKSIANDEFFEWDHHYGYYYGSSKTRFIDFMSTKPLGLLIVDPTGAHTIKEALPEVVTIFIKPESTEDLNIRLANSDRVNDNSEARLAAVQTELQKAEAFDYTVINRQGYLEETVTAILQIINDYRK